MMKKELLLALVVGLLFIVGCTGITIPPYEEPVDPAGPIDPNLEIIIEPGLEVVPGTTMFFDIAGCPAELTCNISMEMSLYPGQSFTPEYPSNSTVDQEGEYTFTYSTEGNANYNAYSVTKTLVVAKMDPPLEIIVLPDVNVEVGTNMSLDVAGCPAELTCNLTMASTQAPGMTFPVTVPTSGPATDPSVIILTYSTEGNEAYNAYSISQVVNISEAPVEKVIPPLNITVSPSSPWDAGVTSTVTGTGCPSELSCVLFRNGATVSNPDVQTLTAGTYTYSYRTNGNAEYTSATPSVEIVVNGAAPTNGTSGNSTGN